LLTRDLMLREVITTNEKITVKEGVDILFKRHIGSIIVIDESQRCIGIFTERDAIRLVSQAVPLDATIDKVMTRNPYVVDVNSTFKEAKEIIKTHKIRHLPVVDSSGKLVGLISVRDILNDLCDL
jgi:CBS domain-containing protein